MENRNNNRQSGGRIIVVLAMLAGMVAGVMSAQWLNPDGHRISTRGAELAENMTTLVSLLENAYVDTLDADSLTIRAYNALLTSLDPHSMFVPAKQYAPHAEELRGNFSGVGMGLVLSDERVYATEVFEGSPAKAGGMLPGDWIVRVDTTTVPNGMPLDSVVKLIRGPEYSHVAITVKRTEPGKRGDEAYRELTIPLKRKVIPHHTVTAALMLKDNSKCGFIRIESFSETTGSEFREALKELQHAGMKRLVLDLRGNGGGLLAEAVSVCDELLPRGALMVYTEGAHERRREFRATGRGLFTEGELTVLIDENSASASEIVAGAVQDNDRGLIAGRRSFGKGLVQRTIQTTDGSALLITTARYYTPSGRCIQRDYKQGTEGYYAEHMLRLLLDDGDDLAAGQTAKVDSTLAYQTKEGRTVYGGGGIVPDQLLPYETDTNYVFYNQLVRNRVLTDYAVEYLHQHYQELVKRYPTVEQFDRGFVVDGTMWRELMEKAAEKVPGDWTRNGKGGSATINEEIKNRLKALLAQNIYGKDAYYLITYPYDRDLKRIKH